jgi:hypothetical protein
LLGEAVQVSSIDEWSLRSRRKAPVIVILAGSAIRDMRFGNGFVALLWTGFPGKCPQSAIVTDSAVIGNR